jgi:type III secretion system HrpE/YscL family protein
MSFLLWHRAIDLHIASPRLVLRAAEVPLLKNALQLCNGIERLRQEQQQYIAAAAREARELAHAQGHEQGLREAQEQAAATLTSLAQSSVLERERLRNEVGALALQVVRKLLGHFADDAVLAALADTATRDMPPAQQLTLIVHPDRCHAVRERLAAATSAGDAPAWRCEVRGDPSCAPGACRIETEHGSVDASLDAQLARLASAWGVNDDGGAS